MTLPTGPNSHPTAASGQPAGALLRELDGTTFIVIDFEALTPAGRSPEPVEVAAIALACRGGQLTETARFTELMRPPRCVPVTDEFTRITAITAGMLSGARPACEVMTDMEEQLVVSGRCRLVAHSAPTEAGLLAGQRDHCRQLAATPLLDTVRLARAAAPGLASYRLDSVLGYYGVPRPADRHRALPDTEVTALIFARLLADGASVLGWATLTDLDVAAGRPPSSPRRVPPVQEPLFLARKGGHDDEQFFGLESGILRYPRLGSGLGRGEPPHLMRWVEDSRVIGERKVHVIHMDMPLCSVIVRSRPELDHPPRRADAGMREPGRHRSAGPWHQPDTEAGLLPDFPDRRLCRILVRFYMATRRNPALQPWMPHQGDTPAPVVSPEDEDRRRRLLDHRSLLGSQERDPSLPHRCPANRPTRLPAPRTAQRSKQQWKGRLMSATWNGMLTCDYEHDRPGATLVELELYTRSLIAWPAVIIQVPEPYGTLRRPGIVDIREEEHHRLTALLHGHLASPARTRNIVTRAAAARAAASATLDTAEALPSPASLWKASAAILPVMSAHVVNWLLPEDRFETLMTKMLGSRTDARACIAALSVPEHDGHLLASLKTTASPGGNAVTARNTWLTAALLAAAGDAPSLDAVRAMAITLQWAAESEERRRELRERFLAAVRAWCARAGLNSSTVTLSDISQAAA